MDPPEKPFKTIEVLDAHTGKTCKIACMSCIRGHRTTACGIPVCRSKIFWTVKRPGRPSNSCTCRYGPGRGCQCVVARSACPHKPRKGEKRTVECRCDEQGRFCCVLEPEQWDVLEALGKPRVELFGSREALEARRNGGDGGGELNGNGYGNLPPTPALSVSTPGTLASTPSTPGTQHNAIQSMTTTPGQHFPEQHPSPVPRFGMMGVGTPWGTNDYQTQDLLTWTGQSPIAPREPPQNTPYPNHPQALLPTYPFHPNQPLYPDPNPLTHSLASLSLPNPDPVPDFDKITADYHSNQFPSAICQNCGLSGCSCRACPAVMQNPASGSWAQGCARKHVAFPEPVPAVGGCCSRDVVDVDPTLGRGLEMAEGTGTDAMDLSEFLMEEMVGLEPGGCCCGGGGR